jgi:hypothetical protein
MGRLRNAMVFIHARDNNLREGPLQETIVYKPQRDMDMLDGLRIVGKKHLNDVLEEDACESNDHGNDVACG